MLSDVREEEEEEDDGFWLSEDEDEDETDETLERAENVWIKVENASFRKGQCRGNSTEVSDVLFANAMASSSVTGPSSGTPRLASESNDTDVR
jgi:hypothetical protein